MKKVFFTLLLLGFVLMFAEENSAFVQGKVFTEKDKTPISGVKIYIDNMPEVSETGKNGDFLLILSPGKHQIIFTYPGYSSKIENVNIKKGEYKNLNLSLRKRIFGGDTIVITGSKTARYIKDAPIRTEVISKKEIENKSATNLYESLDGNVGVKVEQQCSYCNFSMVRIQGMSGDHTQILIDGQPVYTGLASIYGLQQIPSAMIDRIEINKGAGSALYGSSSIGGVINIITKMPSENNSKIMLEMGTHSTNRFSVTNNINKGKWGISLFAQKHENGLIDGSGEGWKQGPDGISDRAAIDDFSAGFDIKGSNIFFRNDVFNITGTTINEIRKGGYLETVENPYAEAAEHIKTNRYQMYLSYKKSFRMQNMLSFTFSSALHNRNATNDTFVSDYMATHSGQYPGTNLMEPYMAKEKTYVANLNYYHIIKKHHFLTGIQYNYDELKESGKYVIIDSSDPNYGMDWISESKKHANESGFFVQDEFKMNKLLEIVFGARYDIHKSVDAFGGSSDVANIENISLKYKQNSFNPRMAIIYKIKNVNLRANIGKGFRVPYGFSEDLHLCSGSPKINKPAGLSPEKSLSYDFSIDYFNTNFSMGINFFRTDVKNIISAAEAGSVSKELGYDYEWQNIDSAYTQGIEFRNELNVGRNFGIKGNLGYTDARYSHEREDWIGTSFENISRFISRVPKITSNLELLFDNDNVSAFFSVNYKGRMYIDYYDEDNEMNNKIVYTPDFATISLKLSKNINKNIKGYFGIKNLTNYIQPERHPEDAAFIYAPLYGRLFYGGVELNF